MIANGWRPYYCRIFKAALDELELAVSKLAANDPEGYKTYPKTKLLASVCRVITQLVPASPNAPDFRPWQDVRLGQHWRRVKKGMPDRYRLFFRFASNPVKVIVHVWFNDENTLRKAGSTTDTWPSSGYLRAVLSRTTSDRFCARLSGEPGLGDPRR